MSHVYIAPKIYGKSIEYRSPDFRPIRGYIAPQALFMCVNAPQVCSHAPYIVLQCNDAKINNTHVHMLFLCYGSNCRNYFFPDRSKLTKLAVVKVLRTH